MCVYLDHVKVVVVGEDGIHFAVQLFEGVLDGVDRQSVIAFIFKDEVVACETVKTVKCNVNKHIP